jgi:hypothetical protein
VRLDKPAYGLFVIHPEFVVTLDCKAMANLLSMGGGIVGIVGLTIQVIQIVQQFGSDWKSAPQDVKHFVVEIEALRMTLSITHSNILVNSGFRKAFEGELSSKAMEPAGDATLNTGFTLEFCKSGLEKLLGEMQPKERCRSSQWDRIQMH